MRVSILALTAFLLITPAFAEGPPNPTGSDLNNNTAGGSETLSENTGKNNTGFGSFVLPDTAGGYNSAVGAAALFDNTVGSHNTGLGTLSLTVNTSGAYNTGIGSASLYSNTTGRGNSGLGFNSLRNTVTGTYNTGIGYQALLRSRGTNNTAIGSQAGNLLTSGSGNLYLGSPGVAVESNTLRLGSVQTRAFIKGVAGVVVRGQGVCVNQVGQLGTCLSEEAALIPQLVAELERQAAQIEALSARVRELGE